MQWLLKLLRGVIVGHDDMLISLLLFLFFVHIGNVLYKDKIAHLIIEEDI